MNLQAIMKQAQNMQKDMLKAKKEIDEMSFEGKNALVTVTIDGTKQVTKVNINRENELTKEDLEMLEDMILLAVNDAIRQVDEITEQKLGKFNTSLPGLF